MRESSFVSFKHLFLDLFRCTHCLILSSACGRVESCNHNFFFFFFLAELIAHMAALYVLLRTMIHSEVLIPTRSNSPFLNSYVAPGERCDDLPTDLPKSLRYALVPAGPFSTSCANDTLKAHHSVRASY